MNTKIRIMFFALGRTQGNRAFRIFIMSHPSMALGHRRSVTLQFGSPANRTRNATGDQTVH